MIHMFQIAAQAASQSNMKALEGKCYFVSYQRLASANGFFSGYLILFENHYIVFHVLNSLNCLCFSSELSVGLQTIIGHQVHIMLWH